MPLNFVADLAIAEGAAVAEDALPLLEFLQSQGGARVDLRRCTQLHTAVLQILAAFRPEIVALPEETFLARWLPLVLGPPATGAT